MYCTTTADKVWRNYVGEEGRLPERPFLIVVPPALVHQVAEECRRFLLPGFLDVVLITGTTEQHKGVWKEADERAKLPSHMRLYIATTTVSVNSCQAIIG
jgi:hypothetical protein